MLMPAINKRRRSSFVDQMQIRTLTNYEMSEQDRANAVNSLEAMRNNLPEKPEERPIDRAKLDKLKEMMRTQPMGRRRRG